jgi:hypothetical protein
MNTPPSLSQQHAGPVFIVGAPRSGTTMLQYILDDLPGLSLPTGESHFIVPLYRNQAAYPDVATPDGMRRLLQTLHDFNAEFLDTDLHGVKFDVETLAQAFLAEGRASVRDVITGIFEHNARGMGKTRWGDKTPYYALHLDKLTEWWPDAKIIHLVRDGRDVALSLFGRKHDFSAYNVYYAAQYWQKYVDVCREQGRRLPPGQYLEIRYEDVLNDKDAAMRTVCDFIGERHPDDTPRRETELDEASRQLKTVNKDNQEKWRRALNTWQIRVFESEAGATLRQSGYPLLTSARRLPLPIRALYRLHNDFSIKLYQLVGRNRRKLNFVVRPADTPLSSSTS